MGDLDLDRLEALLDAARKVVGCTDHGCRLRVRRRGGMGTNGGCMCVRDGRDPDGGTTIYAPRFDVAALLHLARCAPTLLDEVRRLTAALARTEADTRTALDALHTRCDALEAELVTVRTEEREACARVAQDVSLAEQEMRDWLRREGMPCVESHVRHETADLIARRIRARGGDRG